MASAISKRTTSFFYKIQILVVKRVIFEALRGRPAGRPATCETPLVDTDFDSSKHVFLEFDRIWYFVQKRVFDSSKHAFLHV